MAHNDDFEPGSLPFVTDAEGPDFALELGDRSVSFRVCSMGNPHAVVRVDSVEAAEVGILGAQMDAHASFPRGVNTGFAERVREDHVRLRVYERGIGETRACGTGAAAAVAVGRERAELAETVAVSLPGGTLTVTWPGPGSSLWQTGPATTVFEGTVEL